MKNALSIIVILFTVTLYGQESQKLVILHTNDLHSRIEGFSPEAEYSPLIAGNDRTVGGFARIASVIQSERSRNENVVVIDAGDFLMGTLFHTVEEGTGFQLPLMKSMGYDAVALGNHEFDFGPGKIAAIVNRSASAGSLPALLLGNAITDETDKSDDGVEALYASGILRRFTVIEKGGIRIGLFSLMGENASEVAPYSAPVRFAKKVNAARDMVDKLKAEKCDIVICVSHSGLYQGKDGKWAGEDADLAEKVKGIDVIISAHTHSRLPEPLMAKGIPIVQAGEYGKEVGRLELLRKEGKWMVTGYGLVKVDDNILGLKEINDRIAVQKELISAKVLKPFGIGYGDPVVKVEKTVECITDGDPSKGTLGQLVADAIHYYLNKHSSAGADVSMVSAGVIRDSFIPGFQSAADIFRVMPLGSGKDDIPGYPFSRLYFTGRELKNIIEILLVAQKSNTDYHCYYSGLSVRYNPDKGLLKKVISIDIIGSDGKATSVDLSKKNSKLYSVTANSYMLEFIGIIKKKSFGLINVVPKDSSGEKVTDMKSAVVDIDETKPGLQEGKEWLALLEYLKAMKDTDANGIPDLDNRYYSPVSIFETEIK